MTDLAKCPDLSGEVALYDIDINAAKANETIGNALKNNKDAVGKWDYKVYESLETALTDADFVVISILPGTFDEMEADVHMPERLGIYQSVGDTAGPGGIMRAQRTIPMYVEIAKAIEKYSPEAWVINYTNPMSVCVKTLYHVFPKIKAFGCCHEVFGTQKVLMGIMNRSGVAKTDNFHDIKINVLGINHFTWFDAASYKGIDLFPVYRKFIEEHFEEGFFSGAGSFDEGNTFECLNRVKFDLFMKYGNIAAAGDRHLVEFMPGDIYLKDPETVKSWGFGLTPVSWRKKDLENRLRKSRELEAGKPLTLKETGEEGVSLIRAICGLGDVISNVNLPNYAKQISNLPESAVVETNAFFARNSVRPVYAGALDDKIKALVMPHVENHERTMQAALNGDRKLLYDAFKYDRLIHGRISDASSMKLADDMVAATKKYLPQYE
jgi:alpha-galactosidase